MGKMIGLFVLCFAPQIACMNQDRFLQDRLHLQRHEHEHAQELAFIALSNTPLTTATAVGSCELCMEYAINRRGDPSTPCFNWLFNLFHLAPLRDEDVSQAIWHATSRKEKAKQALLLLHEYVDAIKVTKAGRSLLFHAVVHGNRDVARDLLARGAQVDERATGGIVYANHTPLMVAVHASDEPDYALLDQWLLVYDLLEGGAQVNAQLTQTGDTPLLLVQDPSIASLLIDHGAYIDDRNKDGQTVLTLCARWAQRGNDLGDLVRKIVIKGSLRPDSKRASWPCCFELVKREDVWREVLLLFDKARIPRAIQYLIFSYLPMTSNRCSVSHLTHFGDLITEDHAFTATYLASKNALERVVKSLLKQRDKKEVFWGNIFINRLAGAFTKRRLKRLELLLRDFQSRGDVPEFISKSVPEYNVAACWPPAQLREDIQAQYCKELMGDVQ